MGCGRMQEFVRHHTGRGWEVETTARPHGAAAITAVQGRNLMKIMAQDLLTLKCGSAAKRCNIRCRERGRRGDKSNDCGPALGSSLCPDVALRGHSAFSSPVGRRVRSSSC